MRKYLVCATSALVLTGSAAFASTVSVTVDFNSVNAISGGFEQNGFSFTSNNSGGADRATNCPTGTPNSPCLQYSNNEIITVTYSGGTFDVDGFLFNAPGNGGDITVAGGGTTFDLTEAQNGNAMTGVTFTTEFDGLSSFTFHNVANGTGRIDNMLFTVAAVPVPAAGLMLLTGLGAVFARRRRKTA